MIYPYICKNCGHEFDVMKKLAEIDNPENCPDCKSENTLRTLSSRVMFIGASDWIKPAEYNPAFGTIVKDNRHKKELMRKYNVEEIGNEDPIKMMERNEKALDEKCAKRWEEPTPEIK